MKTTQYIGKPYKSSRSNFRDLHKGLVTVDEDGRVLLADGKEVTPFVLGSRFRFFQAETGEDWPKVAPAHGLPKKMRHSCYSQPVLPML